MKFILIPIFEAITIVVVPVYWLSTLSIRLAYGALALTIPAGMIFLTIALSWYGVTILGEFVGIFAVARAIDLIMRGTAAVSGYS